MNETCSCDSKGSCSVCVNQRKLEKNKDKPIKVVKPLTKTPIKKKVVEKKPINLESLQAIKGSVVKPKGSSKRIKSEEELEIEKKVKLKAKELAKKEREKKRKAIKREEKKISKPELLKDVQKLVRISQPNYCFICKTPYQGSRVANGSHFMSSGFNSTCFYAPNLSSGCSHCNSNISTKGEQYLHGVELDKMYGLGHSEKIFKLSKIPYVWSKVERKEMKDLINKYIKLVEEEVSESKKQDLWLEFKEEQEQLDFFKIINQKLNEKQ